MHLKREFVLFQTSSLLFHFVQLVKCLQIFKGLKTVSKIRKIKVKSLFCFDVLHTMKTWEVSCIVGISVPKSLMQVLSCSFVHLDHSSHPTFVVAYAP